MMFCYLVGPIGLLFYSLQFMVQVDMSKWANLAYTGWLTTSQVENEWTQSGSVYGEPEILQPCSTHHGLVG